MRSFQGSSLHITAAASSVAPTAATWATGRRISASPGKQASVSIRPLAEAQNAPVAASAIGGVGCWPTLPTTNATNSPAAHPSVSKKDRPPICVRRLISPSTVGGI